ncbi:transcriptional regulator [Planomonospora sphaerica]|uniref:Transcriptional regulator n=1 Tax=Planomonospora sphaerica TaxID=161355 RepID=A0A171DQS0_9ACTN|nr:transcriptional regulator [Planomonospora sphaerica]GAT71408.1 transcriptional regulator [Planomonospora sphaerica]
MTRDSPPDLLVLHAVRLTGFADTPVIAHRFGLDAAETEEALRDAEARGWVGHTAFAGTGGWSLTDSGRAENERRLAAELARAGGADEVRAVHREFLPLNARLLRACTDWQIRPAAGDRLAVNDHSDPAWDARILRELADIDRALAPLADRLGSVLTRFRGYDTRFAAALARARAGEGAWVDRTDVDSCHRVWFELHEDLIATLGLDRHAEP